MCFREKIDRERRIVSAGNSVGGWVGGYISQIVGLC